MSQDLIIILLALIIGFATLAFLIRGWLKSTTPQNDGLFSDLLKSFDSRQHEQSREIRAQTQALNERLDNAARIISSVQKNIGEFSEIGRSMQDLQKFFKNPKLRGNLGEEVLADLITQLFPKHSFFLQYTFKSGARVDAAIKTDPGILPIDAKFPLENYQKMVSAETDAERKLAEREFAKNVRGHMEDIAQKYILPEEGTLDFALMYVPSEQVYYEVVTSRELMNLARKLRVYPVSPTTMYAHLQTILLSFAGKQIETKTKRVFSLLRGISNDYEKIVGSMGVLTKHIGNAYNQMNVLQQGVTILGQKLTSAESLNTGEEVDTATLKTPDTVQPELL